MAQQLPKLVLNRNHLMITTLGHVINFKKGEPTHVPQPVYKQALALGANPVDGEEMPDLSESQKNAIPTDPDTRTKKILAAIEKMVERNDRTDFTGAGIPNANTVSREVGFSVQSKELHPIWSKYQEDKASIE